MTQQFNKHFIIKNYFNSLGFEVCLKLFDEKEKINKTSFINGGLIIEINENIESEKYSYFCYRCFRKNKTAVKSFNNFNDFYNSIKLTIEDFSGYCNNLQDIYRLYSETTDFIFLKESKKANNYINFVLNCTDKKQYENTFIPSFYSEQINDYFIKYFLYLRLLSLNINILKTDTIFTLLQLVKNWLQNNSDQKIKYFVFRNAINNIINENVIY